MTASGLYKSSGGPGRKSLALLALEGEVRYLHDAIPGWSHKCTTTDCTTVSNGYIADPWGHEADATIEVCGSPQVLLQGVRHDGNGPDRIAILIAGYTFEIHEDPVLCKDGLEARLHCKP